MMEKNNLNKADIINNFQNSSAIEKIEIVAEFLELLKKDLGKKEIEIPVKVFDNKFLGCLEAIVKYLRESLKLRFVKIAELLNRNDKTIWTTYQKAKKKMPMPFSSFASDINIPTSVFSNRDFSILESLVGYLKKLGLRNNEIAAMIHRDNRTIWTIYDRVKKKRGED